jgi:hypothetical protein
VVALSDLALNTRLLEDVVRALDIDVHAPLPVLELALPCLAVIGEALRDLAGVKRKLENSAGEAMIQKRHVVMGFGTFERTPYRPGRRKCFDEEGLWRAVLDTRVVTADGEILSPLDVVVRAYGSESRENGRMRLTGASPMKIEALGIAPDDFFERSPRAGWTIQVFR